MKLYFQQETYFNFKQEGSSFIVIFTILKKFHQRTLCHFQAAMVLDNVGSIAGRALY
jgi:hypothetical protein